MLARIPLPLLPRYATQSCRTISDMAIRRVLAVAAAVAAIAAMLEASGARRWQMYEDEMQHPADDPPDAWEKTEFAFGRLRFRSPRDRGRGGWRGRHARWGTDANRSERHFMMGLRRLSRVHVRSVEQIVDIDSDEIYEYPWMYAVGVGDWMFSESQAERMKQFFERGGFLMVDDFHNDSEFADFMAGVERILPSGTLVELDDFDPIFHNVYNLADRYRVPGINVVHGSEIERGGVVPHWRGIVDGKGRVQIAICHNMDLGDAWEWADLPEYPEKFSSMAYRIGVNYVVYAMTH